jgi:hypothetical protein
LILAVPFRQLGRCRLPGPGYGSGVSSTIGCGFGSCLGLLGLLLELLKHVHKLLALGFGFPAPVPLNLKGSGQVLLDCLGRLGIVRFGSNLRFDLGSQFLNVEFGFPLGSFGRCGR